MRGVMRGVIAALLLWVGSASAAEVGCVVAEGPARARAAWRGVEVVARDGAIEIGGRRITACEGLPGAFPTAVAASGDVLYVGFRAAGLHRFDGEGFEAVSGLPADAVSALAVDGDRVWVGTGAGGLWRVRDGRATRFRHWVLGKRPVTALHVARDGDLHVGAGPYGWWRVRGEEGRRVEKDTYVGCFAEVGGKVRALPPGRACGVGQAGAASGLPSGHVTALEIFEGTLYVGTFDAGLARRTDAGRFEEVPGAPRFVNALLGERGRLWIGTPKGLFRLEKGEVREAGIGLPSDHVNGLARGRDGTIWVATSNGLAGVGRGGVRVIDRAHGLPARIVYSVAVTEDGAVWAGTAGGVARFGEDGVTVFTQANGALPHDWVNALLADGDEVLAGTYDAGVARLTADGSGAAMDGLEGAWVNPGGLARVGDALLVSTLGGGLWRVGEAVEKVDGLPSEDVTATVRVGDALWVGTRGGLAWVGLGRG